MSCARYGLNLGILICSYYGISSKVIETTLHIRVQEWLFHRQPERACRLIIEKYEPLTNCVTATTGACQRKSSISSNDPIIQVSSVLNLVLPQQQPLRQRTPPAARATRTTSRPQQNKPSHCGVIKCDLCRRDVDCHVLLTKDTCLLDVPSSAVSA